MGIEQDFRVKKGLVVGQTITTDGILVSGNASFTATSAIKLPAGTEAQRPTGIAGQLRFNSESNQFEGYNGAEWGSIGGGGLTGGGDNAVFLENDQTIIYDYDIKENKNALTVGPVVINSGVTVTVPTTSRWVIL